VPVRGAAALAVGADEDADVEPSVVALAGVVAAADEEIEVDAGLDQPRELARRRRDEARAPGRPQGLGLARDEEHRVVAVERQRPVRPELLPDRDDRPLAVAV